MIDRPGVDRRRIRLAHRLNSTAVHLLRRISRDDGRDGLTGARLSALAVLVFGRPMSLGQLARVERVATPTMTRIVDGLARDGLVVREPDPTDRRGVRIIPTPTGRDVLERGRARRIDHLVSGLATFDEQELDDLERGLALLERLAARRTPVPTQGLEVRR